MVTEISINQAFKKPSSFKTRGTTGVCLGHDSTKAAYVRSNGEVKWNLSEIEVLAVEHRMWEDVIEVQDIRELCMGWAWFVNDLRGFLPAWQDMELASTFPEEPVSQVDPDVPLEPAPVEGSFTPVRETACCLGTEEHSRIGKSFARVGHRKKTNLFIFLVSYYIHWGLKGFLNASF